MKRTTVLTSLAALVGGTSLALVAPAAPASAWTDVPVTGLASAKPGGVRATPNGTSDDADVSGNGRYVAFTSSARLAADDTDAWPDVYVKDLLTDQVERISTTLDGTPADGSSSIPAISHDGRYVAFASESPKLVANDTNGVSDVFVRDRRTGTTERTSVSSSEAQVLGRSPAQPTGDALDVSDDGRFVTFSSLATSLASAGTPGADVYVRDRQAGTTELVSQSSSEVPGDAGALRPSMSADGRYVAFDSTSTNLVTGDTNGVVDVFVRDRQATTTVRASLINNGNQAALGSGEASISDNGQKVAFTALSALTTTDKSAVADVYVRNLSGGTTTQFSLASDGSQPNGDSLEPSISGDGATVAFASSATNLGVAGSGLKVFTRAGSQTKAVSVSTSGATPAGTSRHPSTSYDGKATAFRSTAPLVAGGGGYQEVYFRRAPQIGAHPSTAAFASAMLGHFGGSPAAAAAGTAALDAGASPAHQAVVLANSPAFAGHRAPVIRLYTAYFKRLPDLGGLEYWVGKRKAGTTLNQISASFAGSSEFKAMYGTTDPTAFVTLVYQNVLSRQPDAGGLAHWVKKMQQGMSRGQVMTSFSESNEGKRHFTPEVQGTLFTLGLLGTTPPPSMWATLRTAIHEEGPESGLLVVASSSQYVQALKG